MFRTLTQLSRSTFQIARRARSDRSDATQMFGGLDDYEVTCLTLHPVCYPNHGPAVELSLASEALGLVRSLDWEIVLGPTKLASTKKEDDEDNSEEEESASATRGRILPTVFNHNAVAR